MKNYYFLLFALAALPASSQIINFPDPLFKQYLLSGDYTRDASGNAILIDQNSDGEVEASEALLVYGLSVEYDVSSVVGIQAFTNITSIYVNFNNALTSMDISDLSNLASLDVIQTPLQSIIFNGTNLSNLNIHDNPALDTLTFGATLSQNHNITSIALPNNHLTTFDFSTLNSAVTDVDLSHNFLTSFIPPLPDSGITRIDLSYNQLSSFDFGQLNSAVMNLYLNNNQIANFDFMPVNHAFTELNVSENPNVDLNTAGLDYVETFIGAGSFTNSVKVENLQNLHTCGLLGNNINFLDFRNGINESCFSIFIPCGGFFGNTFSTAINPNQLICADDFPDDDYTDGQDKSEENYFRVVINGIDGNPALGPHVSTYCSFTPGGAYNTVAGNVAFDCSGANRHIEGVTLDIADPAINGHTHTNANGDYTFYAVNNGVTVTPHFENEAYFTISPPSYTYNFASSGETQTGNFCVSPNGVHPDLEVSFYTLTNARPGFDAKYLVVYKNKGNQTQTGTVGLSFNDAVMDFVSATVTPDAQPAGALNWNFTDLKPFESRSIVVTFHVNAPTDTPPVNIGDVLDFAASVISSGTDETPSDNTSHHAQVVTGSFDPNDKVVTEGEQVDIANAGDYLHYIVNFQNTGTAAAENVVVKDILDANLDWNTVEVLGASHPYRTTQKYGNVLEFFFEGIDLPASTVNEPGSHGYVAFKVKPKSDLAAGSVIKNSANIYFDFNFAIPTNTTQTTFSVLKNQEFAVGENVKVYPNPADQLLNIEMPAGKVAQSIRLFDMVGRLIKNIPTSASENTVTTDVTGLRAGSYFVKVATADGESTQKFVKK